MCHPRHQNTQGSAVRLPGLKNPLNLSLENNGDPVREVHNLLQLLGDKENPVPFPPLCQQLLMDKFRRGPGPAAGGPPPPALGGRSMDTAETTMTLEEGSFGTLEGARTPGLSQPDLEIERVLLGALMANSDDAMPQAIEARLEPGDFFRGAHGEIYGVMRQLYEVGTAVDQLTVYHALTTRGTLSSVGGAAYLAELFDLYGVPQNVSHYAKLVIDRAVLRRLQVVSGEIADKCRSNPPSVAEVLDEAEAAIYGIRDSRDQNSLALASKHLDDVFCNIALRVGQGDDAISGVPTGFKYLDHKTGGFQRSDLIILGGRPGMGKTSLALNFAVAVAIPSKREVKKDLPAAPVAIFSMEMGVEQVLSASCAR